jgi:hypothetical protein
MTPPPLLLTRPLATPLGLPPRGTLRPLEDVLALLTSAGVQRIRCPQEATSAAQVRCCTAAETSYPGRLVAAAGLRVAQNGA